MATAIQTRQEALTLFADVRAGEEELLRDELALLGEDPAGNDVLPFGELTGVHFARLVLLDAVSEEDGGPIPAKLVMLTDVDGDLEEHIEELLETAGPGLDRIFGHCTGYPRGGVRGAGSPAPARRETWVRDHLVPADTLYVNTVGRTVEQVHDEAALHAAIEEFLDGGDWSDRSARQARAAIQDFVNTRHEFGWAMAPPPDRSLGDRLRDLPELAKLPLAVAALSPLLIPAVPLWFALLIAQELRDPVDERPPDEEHAEELASLEDFAPQNQFTATGFVKPGPVRRFTASTVLRLADYGTRHIFNRGDLTGVHTIHFARWVFMDDQKRLLFASNYDGSLESYMDDFIDKVAWGLNAVFSNGVGYPRTYGLLLKGATQEEQFKSFLRRRQVPTQVWYSAYPDLTALNIENNARIRAGLVGDLSGRECEEWLARI